jgi:hypothetical protein
MPTYDPSKNGWTTFFLTSGIQVTLPEQLTKKWWDKKKQLLAKTRATGIGEMLDELPGLINACDWTRFPGSPTAVEGAIENMTNFVKSSQLKALRAKLKEIKETAKTEATHYRKSVTTKKTAEVLDEIETIADQLFVCTNPASLGEMYKLALADYNKVQLEKAKKGAGPTLNAVKLVIKKFPAAQQEVRRILEKVKENPDQMIPHGEKKVPTAARSAWGERLRALCRDMTQPLGNLMKAYEAEVALSDYDDGEVTNLYKEISKISNTKSHAEFADKLNGTQAEGLTKKVEGWCTRFDELLSDVELGA